MSESGIEWTDIKVCSKCGQRKTHSEFARDTSRADGLTYWCKYCRNRRARQDYKPKPGERFGPLPAPPRPGDKRQARKRINQMVLAKKLQHPNTHPCADCGHVYKPGERRHEYDHHLGYDAEHHTHVEAVCTRCHHAREIRRERNE